MISLPTAFVLIFALVIIVVLWGVMRPLYTPGTLRNVLAGFKPNFRYRETYAINMAKRAELAKARAIYKLDISDDERTAYFRNKHANKE